MDFLFSWAMYGLAKKIVGEPKQPPATHDIFIPFENQCNQGCGEPHRGSNENHAPFDHEEFPDF